MPSGGGGINEKKKIHQRKYFYIGETHREISTSTKKKNSNEEKWRISHPINHQIP